MIASYGLTNCAGIAIEDIKYDIDDYVKARLVVIDEDKPKRAYWYKIRYEFTSDDEDAEARTYFLFKNTKIYLDECMRVD